MAAVAASTMRAASVPTRTLVPSSTVTGRSVFSRIVTQGTPIAVVPTALSEYLAESHSATYTAPPLPAGRAFSLTIFQEVLRADDGSMLGALGQSGGTYQQDEEIGQIAAEAFRKL